MCIRPGAMHIITSFLGCIGTLVKGSGLDVLVGAAFGSMNGIITGLAWVRAMRAFRMVLDALLHNFLHTGAKTCEEISAYMDEARKHPTGRYWVDNFLKPTVLTHQFIRAERGLLALPATMFGADVALLAQCWTVPPRSPHLMTPARYALPATTQS